MSSQIIYSKKDLAGKNVAKILEKEYCGLNIKALEQEILFLDQNKENFLKQLTKIPDFLIVASRHKSSSGKPSLTTHVPGNFGQAQAGGQKRELAMAPAFALRKAILSLKEQKSKRKIKSNFEATLEVTHHGPTSLPFPILFVEVGSKKKDWENEEACIAVAKTIAFLAQEKELEKKTVGIGIGGGHYCPKFSKDKIIENYALGHICPRYQIKNLDEEMIKEMIQKTIPQPDVVLVEKEGLGKWKRKVYNILENVPLRIIEV